MLARAQLQIPSYILQEQFCLNHYISDVDPDPQNLMRIRIEVNKINKLILKHILKLEEKNQKRAK